MLPKRKALPAVVGPFLLAAVAVAVYLRRQQTGGDIEKLPEKSTAQEETTIWATSKGLTERGRQAVAALKSADARGLRPGDYGVGLDATAPAELDAAIAKNLSHYAADIRNGRWNQGLYKEAAPAPKPEELLSAVTGDPAGIDGGLAKLDPPFAEYHRLVDALAQARDANTPPEQIAEMERTLDRWRWLPRHFDRGPIIVNVPEFRLRALNDQMETALEMNVVVGQTTHRTPLFMGRLQYLMFAPYWNVPPSILSREMLPDIEKDRGYLASHGFEVQDAEGEVVSTGEVSDDTLRHLRSGAYKVRQTPGSRNALGKVKFMFPNQDNVYLHDTNAPKLFAKAERAYSHGCIRVENPEALAAWVLREDPSWTPDRLDKALKSKKQLQANLKHSIPVLIVYHTVTVSPSGQVQFHKDLYGQDAALAAKIDGAAKRAH